MMKFIDCIDPDTGEIQGDYRDVLNQIGDICASIVYYELFFPTFDLVEDSVLWDDGSGDHKERFSLALKKAQLPLAELEASFNQVELAYLFHFQSNVTERIEMKLAQCLQRSWGIVLREQFPERQFNFTIWSPEESGSVLTLVFNETR